MIRILFIVAFFFSTNLYAPEILIRPSEKNPITAYIDGSMDMKGKEHFYFQRCVALQLSLVEANKQDFDLDLELLTEMAKRTYDYGLRIMQKNLSHQDKDYVKNSFRKTINQYMIYYLEDMDDNRKKFGHYLADSYLLQEMAVCIEPGAEFREF